MAWIWGFGASDTVINRRIHDVVQHSVASHMRTSWPVNVFLLLVLCEWNPPVHSQSASNADPDSKVHGANMEPIWGRQDPDGPHVGPMNFTLESFYIFFAVCLNKLLSNWAMRWCFEISWRSCGVTLISSTQVSDSHLSPPGALQSRRASLQWT